MKDRRHSVDRAIPSRVLFWLVWSNIEIGDRYLIHLEAFGGISHLLKGIDRD